MCTKDRWPYIYFFILVLNAAAESETESLSVAFKLYNQIT